MKVKLRFLAPSAGIAEVAKCLSSPRPHVMPLISDFDSGGRCLSERELNREGDVFQILTQGGGVY